MQQLNEALSQATAAIEQMYFQLPIDGSDRIFRERVYCYELYHQLRRIWPADTPFSLNGEVDKQGHALVQATGARVASPDLLVHIPGSMADNHAIIEVKPALLGWAECARISARCRNIAISWDINAPFICSMADFRNV